MTHTILTVRETGTGEYLAWPGWDETSSMNTSAEAVERILVMLVDSTNGLFDDREDAILPEQYTGSPDMVLPRSAIRPHFHIVREAAVLVQAIASVLPIDEQAESYSRALIERAAGALHSEHF